MKTLAGKSMAPDAQVQFRVATTKNELKAAFRLLHDSYVTKGWMTPTKSELRITKYHLVPKSVILIACIGKEVIGTVSILADSELGLPMDTAFSLADFRAKNFRIAEISSLAICSTYQEQRYVVFYPLIRFLARYCLNHMGIDKLVFAADPKLSQYYEKRFLVAPLDSPIQEQYKFVNGARAQGFSIDLSTWMQKMQEKYEPRPLPQNLHKYILLDSVANIRFPSREARLWGNILPPDLLRLFGEERSSVFKELTSEERKCFRMLYPLPGYQGLFADQPTALKKRCTRYEVQGSAKILFEGKELGIQLRNISESGFCGTWKDAVALGTHSIVPAKIGANDSFLHRARLVWRDASGLAGFEIVEADSNWCFLLQALEKNDQKNYGSAMDLNSIPLDFAASAARAPLSAVDPSVHERSQRFRVKSNASIRLEQKNILFQIANISQKGFRAVFPPNQIFGADHIFQVRFGGSSGLTVSAKPVWRDIQGNVGFELIDADSRWESLVQRLRDNFEQNSGQTTQIMLAA